MTKNDLPLVFGFMLAQDPQAMKIFAELPKNRRTEILQKAHSAASKEEMQLLVNELVTSSAASFPNRFS
ncbi:MAG: hypothetical protein IJ411_02315 [Oscillospiraceae bacterium]|nr:hypothetical protein [Oscillospiraceae bacterium]